MKYPEKHIRAWNSGMTVKQATKYCGECMKEAFKLFGCLYGTGCIPVQDMFKRPFSSSDTDNYKRWKGIIGHGENLRKLIRGKR